ncbi:MAG: hypothetical protein H7X95_12720, partial [Deltaproteobacteria bacterium]|nr:hypothetical protein [Deltaproteobacteria bacterium]
RGLSMGGAGRADARGGAAPLMNPAGMSLARVYTLEGGYQFMNRGGGHLVHTSVVDSTSGFNLAGAAFYTYRTASTPTGGTVSGHEPGLSLSFPFGDRVLVGVSGKYLRVSGGPAEPDARNSHSGITADVGLIVRAGAMLTLGVAGYNLRDLSTVHAPVALGYGAALTPMPDFVIAVDGLHDFTTTDPSRGVTTSIGGGAEYTFQRRVVFRGGGGRDGRSRNGYVAGGIAGMSELGAVDFGFRQDVAGDYKATVFVVGLRLFVPQP